MVKGDNTALNLRDLPLKLQLSKEGSNLWKNVLLLCNIFKFSYRPDVIIRMINSLRLIGSYQNHQNRQQLLSGQME